MKVQGPEGAPKPQYFDDPATDALYRMVLTLGEEVAVLQEELHAIRSLHDAGTLPTTQAMDSFAPSAQFDEQRQQFVSRLLEPIQALLKQESQS